MGRVCVCVCVCGGLWCADASDKTGSGTARARESEGLRAVVELELHTGGVNVKSHGVLAWFCGLILGTGRGKSRNQSPYAGSSSFSRTLVDHGGRHRML